LDRLDGGRGKEEIAAMQIIDHEQQSHEDWRPGVSTRMRVSALTGASNLTIFEQWAKPGHGAPPHRHTVEEVITVIDGHADITLNGESATLTAGQSVVVPAGSLHSFRNSGEGSLHIQFTLAAGVFEAVYGDSGRLSQRWVPGPRA
jgi:quercetin dioxygenase-like cupin family protein